MTLDDFIASDTDRLSSLVEEYPCNLSVQAVASFLSLDVASVRAAIENNAFGMAWRKAGSTRHGYLIPTAQFVRWYLNKK